MNIKKRLKDIDSYKNEFLGAGFNLDDINSLKEKYIRNKEMEKQIQENTLKIDNTIPRIYYDEDITCDIIDEFYETYTCYPNGTINNAVQKSGYIIFNIKDLINVNMPQGNEKLMYIVQHHGGSIILDNIAEIKERLYDKWSKLTIYYDFNNDKQELILYNTDDVKISNLASSLEKAITDILKHRDKLLVEYDIKFDTTEDDDMIGCRCRSR